MRKKFEKNFTAKKNEKDSLVSFGFIWYVEKGGK